MSEITTLLHAAGAGYPGQLSDHIRQVGRHQRGGDPPENARQKTDREQDVGIRTGIPAPLARFNPRFLHIRIF